MRSGGIGGPQKSVYGCPVSQVRGAGKRIAVRSGEDERKRKTPDF